MQLFTCECSGNNIDVNLQVVVLREWTWASNDAGTGNKPIALFARLFDISISLSLRNCIQCFSVINNSKNVVFECQPWF